MDISRSRAKRKRNFTHRATVLYPPSNGTLHTTLRYFTHQTCELPPALSWRNRQLPTAHFYVTLSNLSLTHITLRRVCGKPLGTTKQRHRLLGATPPPARPLRGPLGPYGPPTRHPPGLRPRPSASPNSPPAPSGKPSNNTRGGFATGRALPSPPLRGGAPPKGCLARRRGWHRPSPLQATEDASGAARGQGLDLLT